MTETVAELQPRTARLGCPVALQSGGTSGFTAADIGGCPKVKVSVDATCSRFSLLPQRGKVLDEPGLRFVLGVLVCGATWFKGVVNVLPLLIIGWDKSMFDCAWEKPVEFL